MFLLFRQGSVRLLLVSLHAPHRATAEAVIQAWWCETKRLLHRHGNSATVVIGGDCNAAVGSVPSNAVGEHDAERMDEAGVHLEALLNEFGLHVASLHL